MCDLTEDCERWAYCFQSLIFTLGIQATQRVEGLFSQLRQRLNRSSSLIDVLKAIEDINDRRYAQSLFKAAQGGDTSASTGKDAAIKSAFKDLLSSVQNNCSR